MISRPDRIDPRARRRLAAGPRWPFAQQNEVTSDEVVTRSRGPTGCTRASVANHTKGRARSAPSSACRGRRLFPSALSRETWCRWWRASPWPVEIRGRPNAERTPRGMALEFRLPNGALQHMTMINTPMFLRAMPRTFLTDASAPDPTRTRASRSSVFEAFAASHPDNQAQRHSWPAQPVAELRPPSPTTASTRSSSSTARTGSRWALRFVPQDGEKALADEALPTCQDFLERCADRADEAGAGALGHAPHHRRAGRPEDDPTLAWPKERKEMKVGTLTISSAMAQNGAGCENITTIPSSWARHRADHDPGTAVPIAVPTGVVQQATAGPVAPQRCPQARSLISHSSQGVRGDGNEDLCSSGNCF